jgi:hypothetical protein
MNRNIVIVITILILAIIAGYLVWLRSRLAPEFNSEIQRVEEITQTALPDATPEALPTPASASPSASVSASPRVSPRASATPARTTTPRPSATP